jgi:xanthine dehydrogenase iron-sulfur cluster and FAD-binding subunit A
MNEMTNSHIVFHPFAYLEPASVAEAVQMLQEYGAQAKILAGGTDLIVQLKMDRSAPGALISLGKIPGLDQIATRNGHLHLGARATIRAIEQDERIQAHFAALTDACVSFSTTQVQTMGTVGGNLGNGSPASDSAPALIALGAEVALTGPDGQRRLPLEKFFTGPGKTVLQRGELITEVILPRPAAGTGSAFMKISRVAADIAKASAAVRLVREGDRVMEARLAFGSVGPTPMRAPRAEQALAGQPFSEDLVTRAAQIASEEITPIDDVRSTAAYRRDVVRAMVYDALHAAWRRAGQGDGQSWLQDPELRSEVVSPPARRMAADEKRQIELKVNGKKHSIWVAPNELLLNVLRERLQLTGTKYGCGIGECSACTVQLDGAPVLSCLVLAVSAAGHEIITVEGLQTPDGELDPLQEAFIDHAAYQCGFCTPGQLITAKTLLNENPSPTEDEVRHYMRGNICRCTGYVSIVRAVMAGAAAAPDGAEEKETLHAGGI